MYTLIIIWLILATTVPLFKMNKSIGKTKSKVISKSKSNLFRKLIDSISGYAGMWSSHSYIQSIGSSVVSYIQSMGLGLVSYPLLWWLSVSLNFICICTYILKKLFILSSYGVE